MSAILAVTVAAVVLCAPLGRTWVGEYSLGALIMPVKSQGEPRITVTGTRMTKGNAVDCPQLRADDGTTYSVHPLSAAVAIGDRITVTGFLAHVTACRGDVLYVEELFLLERK